MSSSDDEGFKSQGSVDSNNPNEEKKLDDDNENVKIEESNISNAPKQSYQNKKNDLNESENLENDSNEDNNNKIENNNSGDNSKKIQSEKKEEKNDEKKEDKKDEEEKEEKSSISVKFSHLNIGNQLILNKKKDVIEIEIDKEKTSQKKYTVYQLNLINDNSNKFSNNLNTKNEKKILCYRRYKDFEKFYNFLKLRFPQYVFPRLSQKNYVKAKVQDDPVFNENRRKELQYFVNQLYFHREIGKSEEFKQFLYYSTYDDQYYENLPKKYYYPEYEKLNKEKGYLSKGMQKFSSFFYKSKDYKKSEPEKYILSREEEFKNKDVQYNNLLKDLRVLYETTEEEAKEYKILSNNLLYLKDNGSTKYLKNDNEYNKNKFNELINLNQNFSEILKNNSLVYLSEIIDQLNYCILDVEGINRAIQRYIEFIEEYKKIQEINVKNNNSITQEIDKSKIDKGEFETCISEDIRNFDKEKSQIYEEIIGKIILYIKSVNENTDEVFQNSNFIS